MSIHSIPTATTMSSKLWSPPPVSHTRASNPSPSQHLPASLLLHLHLPLPAPTFRSRRALALLVPALLFPPSRAVAEELLDLYTDSNEGFVLLRPSSWLQVEKAGATALFEDSADKGNNIGVVVSSVRLSSLRDFGTPEFVAEKLIQAERRKESTKAAQVVSFAERSGHDGTPIYEFEYTLDSTRGGLKRIFSAAFVDSKKLYLLNIVHSDRPDRPLGRDARLVLERVLHSFDLAN